MSGKRFCRRFYERFCGKLQKGSKSSHDRGSPKGIGCWTNYGIDWVIKGRDRAIAAKFRVRDNRSISCLVKALSRGSRKIGGKLFLEERSGDLGQSSMDFYSAYGRARSVTSTNPRSSTLAPGKSLDNYTSRSLHPSPARSPVFQILGGTIGFTPILPLPPPENDLALY